MGMFTWVNPAKELLPEDCQHLEGWQTKDVVDRHLETLEITPDGNLVYIWYDRKWVDDKSTLFGGFLERTIEHRDILDYHGDMFFYTGNIDDPNDSEWELVEFRARFTNGKLESIKRVESEE